MSLWDADDHFFKDLILTPEGGQRRLDVFSWVGIIPLFACEVVDAHMLSHVPRFRKMLYEHRGGMFDGHTICACPEHTNEKGEHLETLEKFHRYLGDNFKVSAPGLAAHELTLKEINGHLSERLINLFRRDANGMIPAYPVYSPLQNDPYWQDQLLFHEYFHAETGQGLGASHQTGWTALVSMLIVKQMGNRC
jgi:hypothetical protein